jgi:hypothetical protein
MTLDKKREGNMFPEQLEERANALTRIVDWMIQSGLEHTEVYVDKLRSLNPDIPSIDLANKIVSRKSFKNGLVGAVTGLGGLITLPVSAPSDIATSWKIQIMMALSVARAFGHDQTTTDLRTDIYLILAGDSAKEAVKRFGIEASKEITKKAVEKHVTREVMKKIWRYIPQKIVTKAGQKSITSFMKMVPFVGAPIGFGFDWIAARAVGKTAIRYYSA